jgi:hypothetical protein
MVGLLLLEEHILSLRRTWLVLRLKLCAALVVLVRWLNWSVVSSLRLGLIVGGRVHGEVLVGLIQLGVYRRELKMVFIGYFLSWRGRIGLLLNLLNL